MCKNKSLNSKLYMQLSTIKISNILSFPYVENLTTIEGVKFHNEENWVINIIIWPNGSGKSNLLDIVHAVWKYGITINYGLKENNNNFTIINTNKTNHSLNKHRGQENQKSHIYISILLNQEDHNNLFFLVKNREIINNIIAKHSTLDIRFAEIQKEDILQYPKIPLYFTFNDNNELILERNTNTTIQWIVDYLQNFELIQKCMEIHNTNWQNRYPLRNTFALITSYDHKTQTNKPLRLFCKKVNCLSNENTPSLLQKFFLESVNTTLNKYINLTIQHSDNLSENNFLLVSKNWYTFSYEELSSWEQSFLTLILLIYSHDLRNWLLIIDEPELHLHPQSQKEFLWLLEEMKTKQYMQCIIATHSPAMINEHNINHVFRCSKKNGITSISSTSGQFWENESTLLQMLKFDNIAKIFFVDTIILVEGETDMYFLSHYIEYLKTQPSRTSRIKNYEIITISGKWWIRRWKQFLKKFNNHVYYIGDRDNTIEYNLLSLQELSSIPHKRLQHNKWSKYASIVEYIKKSFPDLYTRIVSWIQRLYKNNIFLLKQWDLEAYIGTQSKWLDDTVYFCLHHFDKRIKDNQYQEKRNELLFIIDRIFSQNW